MNSKFIRNLSWIFVGNIAHAVLQFLLNIICARAFGTDDYGLINYAASLIAFFAAIGTLGFQGVITKYFAEDEDKAGELIGTGMIVRLAFSVVSIILLQVLLSFFERPDLKIRLVVFCQSLQILFAAPNLFIYWFRYKSEAKTVAILRLMAFFFCAVWKLVAILSFHSIVIYVLGVSLETGLFSLLLIIWFRKQYDRHKIRYSRETLIKLIKLSYPFIFSALLITIYGQTDKIMLKKMLSNTAVGLYSVSLSLAGAVSIIPSALIEGFRPDIMTFRIKAVSLYRQRMKQLYGIVFWICIAYCIFITVFSKPVIAILYGEQYLDAVPALSLVVWYTSFSYIGSINSVYMVAENKTQWVQITTLVGAGLNVLLNYLLIPSLGIVGAALASLLTQFVANFVLLMIIPPLRGAFVLAVEGMTLKGLNTSAIRNWYCSITGKK